MKTRHQSFRRTFDVIVVWSGSLLVVCGASLAAFQAGSGEATGAVEEVDIEAVRAEETADRVLMLGLLLTCLILATALAAAILFARSARLRSRGTARKSDETEMDHRGLRQAERLDAMPRMIRELIHESRNALQRTHACLHLLSQQVMDRPEALRLVSRVEASQERLHALCEEVREYLAPLAIRREPARLDEIVERAWRRLDPVVQGRSVRLTHHRAGVDLSIDVDSPALEQVFRNIFESSLATCEDPVEIEVRYRRGELDPPNTIEISVSDNGPAVDETQRARVFEPFFTTRTKGLGLAIAKRLVEAHEGVITAEAGRRRGAGISVTLPRPRQERDR